ncbi:MAG: hypothetical protein ACKOQ3_11785 [Novosphingobium sp.]
MAVLSINVHEMFHALFRGGAGGSAIAQVFDEARIVRGEPAEPGPWHSGFAQEALDPGYQHCSAPFLPGESTKE